MLLRRKRERSGRTGHSDRKSEHVPLPSVPPPQQPLPNSDSSEKYESDDGGRELRNVPAEEFLLCSVLLWMGRLSVRSQGETEEEGLALYSMRAARESVARERKAKRDRKREGISTVLSVATRGRRREEREQDERQKKVVARSEGGGAEKKKNPRPRCTEVELADERPRPLQ
jgi:hypothetical protein